MSTAVHPHNTKGTANDSRIRYISLFPTLIAKIVFLTDIKNDSPVDCSPSFGHPPVRKGQGQREVLQGAQHSVLATHFSHRQHSTTIFPSQVFSGFRY